MAERILLVTPVIPATTGNGLAMRAAMTLRGLSQLGQVTLLAHQRYGSPNGSVLAPELASLCAAAVIRPGPGATHDAGMLDVPFDRVHCFRLATLDVAESWLAQAPSSHVDFDDLDSRTHTRMAALHRERGNEQQASAEERLAAISLDAEIRAISRFDRIYLASAGDIDHLPFCGRAEVRVLPNVVDLAVPVANRIPADPFTFLFVGTMTYFPNEDGIRFFCDEVLPQVRAGADREFRVQIVGIAPPSVRALHNVPDVEVTGFVRDVEPYYGAAGAVIVPLRAGGGTRIKLLEAFARGLPVVSTTIGAEGIEVTPGAECLVADDPESLARACLAVMNDADLRASLGTAAGRFVRERHSLATAVAGLS